MTSTQVTASSSLEAIAAAADAAARAALHTLNVPGRQRHSRTRPESTPEIPARHRDQDNRHRETPGHRVRTRLLLAARQERSPSGRRNRPRPPGTADRGTARQARRDTRAAAMPGHRQHNRENRHQDRHGTRRPQHPEQAETPKVPGVGACLVSIQARTAAGPCLSAAIAMTTVDRSARKLPMLPQCHCMGHGRQQRAHAVTVV